MSETSLNTPFKLPRWDEIPEIDLYMDQVVGFIEKKLSFLKDISDDLGITSTMINNYVKQDLITPPINKKYNRTHIAQLMVIFTLKRVMSISEISDVLYCMNNIIGIEQGYTSFCEHCEKTLGPLIVSNTDCESSPLMIFNYGIDSIATKFNAIKLTRACKEKHLNELSEKAAAEKRAKKEEKRAKKEREKDEKEEKDKTEENKVNEESQETVQDNSTENNSSPSEA